MPQMGGGGCVCVLLWAFVGFCRTVCGFYEKKHQNKHYLKIIVLAAVPGGGGGEMARGDGG